MTRQEYETTEKVLERFYSNYKAIVDITNDIISLDAVSMNEIRAFYISDTVLSKVIQLDNNETLKTMTYEYKAVLKTLELVSLDARNIFLSLYIFRKSRWDTQMELGLSERTFTRRKSELIYETRRQLKKFF